MARLLGNTRRRASRALWIIVMLALALLAAATALFSGPFVHGLAG